MQVLEKLSLELLQGKDEKFVTVKVRAISSRKIPRFYGVLYIPPEELQKSYKTLIGKPVLKDHNPSVDNVIGKVVDAEFNDNAIYATVEIFKDDPIAEKIKNGLVNSVSVGFSRTLEWSDEEQCYVAKNIKFEELSFVVYPADPSATVLSADKDEEEFLSGDISWVKDEEKRKKAPKDYFLDPDSRKYPYKTWDGRISCELLRRAMSLASLHGHTQIYERAKALYERHCKEKQCKGCEKFNKEVSSMPENVEKLQEELSELKKKLELLQKENEELKIYAEAGKAYIENLKSETKKYVKLVHGENSPLLDMVDTLSDIKQLKAIHDEYEKLAREKLKPSSKESLPVENETELTPEKLQKMSYEELLKLKEKFNKEVV